MTLVNALDAPGIDGPAGGVLDGNYPDPGFELSMSVLADQSTGIAPLADGGYGYVFDAQSDPTQNWFAEMFVEVEDGVQSTVGFDASGPSGDLSQQGVFDITCTPNGAVLAELGVDDINGIERMGFLAKIDASNSEISLGTVGSFTPSKAFINYGRLLGTDPKDKGGFFGADVIAQPAAVAAPTGGAVVDTQARAAIVALINLLSAAAGGLGLTA